LTSGIDFADAPALCGYLDDVTLHVDNLNVCGTSEKQFCLNDINASVMLRLGENQRLRAIGMLQAGLAQNVVARHFGCHHNTKGQITEMYS
jgi:hypothetical protein